MNDVDGSRSLLESAGVGLLTRSARVADVRVLSEHYRRIRLEGELLRKRRWTPGDTVRLVLPGWNRRCYTPVSWDGKRGSVDFIAYVHGGGPGSEWAASVRVGDECQVRGPRGAIDLPGVGTPAVLFGDETSLTSAAALRALDVRTRIVLEVTSISESANALAALGITDAVLLARTADDRQLDEIARLLIAHLRSDESTGAALTGNAISIQRLYKTLRREGFSARRMTNHAYWAPGKKGLE